MLLSGGQHVAAAGYFEEHPHTRVGGQRLLQTTGVISDLWTLCVPEQSLFYGATRLAFGAELG